MEQPREIETSGGLGLGLALGGASGVISILSAAASSHGVGAQLLSTISQMTMLHAGAFIALGLALAVTRSRLLGFALLIIFAGLGLFCGDLAFRFFSGTRLFPMAAPTGGFMMIMGWLLVFLVGLARVFGVSGKSRT
ncbi:DUF423 domain-containing protein [Pseudovibrio sp. SPO723]|uniref:DUF423 domain-containing protein n=1 Tax=Nesiotobacter zosterae TaxID=392721 RepID=UPI0029C2F590|nr:DUF423 domain-containing protein [Pseudovibrio sp. SPO723]MDX5592632.1 DUF423 domain-containing protein [Pseudovibrio sp. SPO723]